jgi:segregation and condensation protein B
VNPLAKLLEAALFSSARPVPKEELAALDPESSPAAVQAALDELRETYDHNGHGVELVELGEGWQILTRPEYTEAIERAQLAVRPHRLSAAALETLAIIAYRQPIGRAEVEEIRGVAVGSVLKSLHERNLIDIVGRSEGIGRPLLYGTTPLFLEQFGLRHLEELPRADELAIALRGAGGLVGTPVEPPPPLLPLGEGLQTSPATAPDEGVVAVGDTEPDAEVVTEMPGAEASGTVDVIDAEADADTDVESTIDVDDDEADDEPYATSDEPDAPARAE